MNSDFCKMFSDHRSSTHLHEFLLEGITAVAAGQRAGDRYHCEVLLLLYCENETMLVML